MHAYTHAPIHAYAYKHAYIPTDVHAYARNHETLKANWPSIAKHSV